ncbi:MAG: GNAT family N-acetyltransferase [Rhizomicrobium sp.]
MTAARSSVDHRIWIATFAKRSIRIFGGASRNAFVAVTSVDEIGGFYTLAATSIALKVLAPEWTRKLPRYPFVPSALLGRLAVAKAHQGRRLGAALVADALLRAANSDLAAHFLIVDAKDENAAMFYEYLGFERLEDGRLIRAV